MKRPTSKTPINESRTGRWSHGGSAYEARIHGRFKAILFDCDGVLVDSRAACRATWHQWASRIGLAHSLIVEKLEGRPVREAMSEYIPAHRLDEETKWFEAMELQSASAVRAMPGAIQAVERLPLHNWAIVTSASRILAYARLAAAGLPLPNVLVSADDVQFGKPDPDCYNVAASRLGVAAYRCLAVEDSSAGTCAASRAGATVLGVGAISEDLQVHIGPVADLRSIELKPVLNEVELSLLIRSDSLDGS